MKDIANGWLNNLGKGIFVSFLEFLEAFGAHWGHGDDQWLLIIQDVKKVFEWTRLINEDLDPSLSKDERTSNQEEDVCILEMLENQGR